MSAKLPLGGTVMSAKSSLPAYLSDAGHLHNPIPCNVIRRLLDGRYHFQYVNRPDAYGSSHLLLS